MRWHFTPQEREQRVNRRYPLPTKNEPPMRGSYTPPEFVPENQGFPIWRNDFGAKNGAQAKRRVEAYLHTRKSTVIRSRQKTNLQHERFCTPPELVPENQGFPIWRNDFG